jgi:hypothetical protein
MGLVDRHTPGLKFGSTDSAFTTYNPKWMAGIFGLAAETYLSDTDSGMSLHFYTTPNNAGANPVPEDRGSFTATGAFHVNKGVSFNLENGQNDIIFKAADATDAYRHVAISYRHDFGGGAIFNNYNTDSDFAINGQTRVAYTYNAGTDRHQWNGRAIFNIGADDEDFFIYDRFGTNALFYEGTTNQFRFGSDVIFNILNADKDFYIYKNSSGTAFSYDAGTDTSRFNTDLIVYGSVGLMVGDITATTNILDVRQGVGVCNARLQTTLNSAVALHMDTNNSTKSGRVINRGTNGNVSVGDIDSGNAGECHLYSAGAVRLSIETDGDFDFEGNDITNIGQIVDNINYTGQIYNSYYTITYASTINPDWNNGDKQRCVLTGNVTVGNPTNLQDGATYQLILQQSSGGGHSVVWGTAYRFPLGGAPAIDTTGNTVTIVSFECWNGIMLGFNSATGIDIS